MTQEFRRFGFEATAAISPGAGLARYTRELGAALIDAGAGPDLHLFQVARRPAIPATPLSALPMRRLPVSLRTWRLMMLLGQYVQLDFQRWLPPTALFHGTDHVLPPLRTSAGVVTVHDLTFLELPRSLRPLNRWFLRLLVPSSVRRARAVIAVSEHTRQSVIRRFGASPSKVFTVHSGIDPRFRPVAARSPRAPYFLYVGTIEPRKNVDGLLDAYDRFRRRSRQPVRLVVAGREGWRCRTTVQRLITTPGVSWLPNVPDAQLPALYSEAVALVHPAWYEGFGFTPLEAMACGTPVIASNVASLPEILGDAAVYVDPGDAKSIEEAMAMVAAGDRAQWSARGIYQAARFTWKAAAQNTLRVYEQALSSQNTMPVRDLVS